MLVGERLKNERKKLGLSQTALGDLVGVSKASICCYEKEVRNPALESILEFVHIFGVSCDYLLGTDNIVEVITTDSVIKRTLTNEEIIFLDELKKDKIVYNILFGEPKRGAELVKKKIG